MGLAKGGRSPRTRKRQRTQGAPTARQRCQIVQVVSPAEVSLNVARVPSGLRYCSQTNREIGPGSPSVADSTVQVELDQVMPACVAELLWIDSPLTPVKARAASMHSCCELTSRALTSCPSRSPITSLPRLSSTVATPPAMTSMTTMTMTVWRAMPCWSRRGRWAAHRAAVASLVLMSTAAPSRPSSTTSANAPWSLCCPTAAGCPGHRRVNGDAR